MFGGEQRQAGGGGEEEEEEAERKLGQGWGKSSCSWWFQKMCFVCSGLDRGFLKENMF